MSAMQKKILGELKTLTEANGYEWLPEASYSNTGQVKIGIPGSFKGALGFAYSFQQGYCTINIFEGGYRIQGGCVDGYAGHLRSYHALNYHDAARLEEFMAFMRQHLPKRKVPRVKKPQKKAKDDIGTPLRALLKEHMESAGTDMNGALRDVATEIIRICGKEQLNAEDIFNAAYDVFTEEGIAAFEEAHPHIVKQLPR